jgi:hypothetical protein
MKKTEPKEKTERERENPRAEAPNPQHKQNQHKPRAKPQALEARSRSFKNSIPSQFQEPTRSELDPPQLWNRSPSDPKTRRAELLEMVKTLSESCYAENLEATASRILNLERVEKWKP